MMLTDGHFTNWGSVKILSLYNNNLVRISGSHTHTMPGWPLAPLPRPH